MSVILLPRNERQYGLFWKCRQEWIAKRGALIREHAVGGLNLIWFCVRVVSDGGMMDCEAAACGVSD